MSAGNRLSFARGAAFPTAPILRVAVWCAFLVVISFTTADPDLWGHVRFGLDILRDWAGVKSVIAAPVIGDVLRPCNRKAKTVLGFTPGPIDEALLATAGSLVRLGLVPPA